jgi:hypothetical protein
MITARAHVNQQQHRRRPGTAKQQQGDNGDADHFTGHRQQGSHAYSLRQATASGQA